MNRKTVLVTGGAGFIGSHLCEQLARNAEYKGLAINCNAIKCLEY